MKKILKTLVLAGASIVLLSLPSGAMDKALHEMGLTSPEDLELLRGKKALIPDEEFYIGYLWCPYLFNTGMYGVFETTCEYPGGSGNDQLWQAGLWAGGYTDEGGSTPWVQQAPYSTWDFYVGDDLGLGWTEVVGGLGDREITTTYNSVGVDDDLGLTVTQRCIMWSDPRYDDFIISILEVEFAKDIEDFYFGWLSDCDVGDNNLPDFYYDDMTGYDMGRGMAYMYDDDSDPADIRFPDQDFLSPMYIGQILLQAPDFDGPVTGTGSNDVDWVEFNWWDWDNDVTDDEDAYGRMSAGTIKETPPPNEYDYRIQTAVGPYEVTAGDEATFVVGYALGERLDEDTELGNLEDHADTMIALWNRDLAIADPYPPVPELPVDPLSDHLPPDKQIPVSGIEVSLRWDSVAEADYYKIYLSRLSNAGPWELVEDNYTGTSYVAEGFVGFPQFFLVTTVDDDGQECTKGSALNRTLSAIYPATFADDETSGITVAPNPYMGSATWELKDYEGRIGFFHLPDMCTIYIYNMLGDLVETVYHNVDGDESPDVTGSETGDEYWDMLSRNNQSVSSGLYVFRVVPEEGGSEYVGKFAVIKGQR